VAKSKARPRRESGESESASNRNRKRTAATQHGRLGGRREGEGVRSGVDVREGRNEEGRSRGKGGEGARKDE